MEAVANQANGNKPFFALWKPVIYRFNGSRPLEMFGIGKIRALLNAVRFPLVFIPFIVHVLLYIRFA